MAAAVYSSPISHLSKPFTHHAFTDVTPSSDQVVISTLSEAPFNLLLPTPSLHSAVLVLAKRIIDPIATSTSQVQEQRLQAARRKRKRGDEDGEDARNVLRMKQIHLEGFGIEQIWEQARRVLNATSQEVEGALPGVLAYVNPHGKLEQKSLERGGSTKINGAHFDESIGDNNQEHGLDLGSDLEEQESPSDDLDEEDMGEEGDISDVEDGDNGGLEENQNEVDLDEAEDIEQDSDIDRGNGQSTKGATPFVKDKFGLNDGFFSIDEFNRNSEFLEQQDARGDGDTGAASDEEDIDWEADPLARSLPAAKGNAKRDDESSSSEDEDDGPTFGKADLDAPFDNTDEDENDDAALPMDEVTTNTNNIYYADFFAPPARAQGKPKRKNRPAAPATEQPPISAPPPTDEQLQRTISAVRRDIFSDDDATSGADSPSDADDPSPTNPHLSTHERRHAALASQIRALEAEALSRRPWTLSGEARAADRPTNALLEEDLDFERAGKPAPVPTAQASADLEALIRARILARDFDEVRKRTPGSAMGGSGAGTKRGLLPLENTRDARGLAEVYEDEHLAARAAADGQGSKADEKLATQHDAIAQLWAKVSAKLDALCSLHYRPKPPGVSVRVLSNAPRVEVEDARPGGAEGAVGEESGLAPQEVYRVG